MKFDVRLDWSVIDHGAVMDVVIDNATRIAGDEALVVQVPARDLWPHSSKKLKDCAMVAVWILPTDGPILIRVSAVPDDVSRRTKVAVVDAIDFFDIKQASAILALADISTGGMPDYRFSRMLDDEALALWAPDREFMERVDDEAAAREALLFDFLPMDMH